MFFKQLLQGIICSLGYRGEITEDSLAELAGRHHCFSRLQENRNARASKSGVMQHSLAES